LAIRSNAPKPAAGEYTRACASEAPGATEVRKGEGPTLQMPCISSSDNGFGEAWFKALQPNKRVKMGLCSIAENLNSQKSIRQFALPKLGMKELAKIEQRLAMHYYVTGTSFAWIEEVNLLNAFRICRPDVVLPSRKQLSERLLEKCYKNIKALTDSRIQETAHFSCLSTDGWSNVKNEEIINNILGGNGLTFFLESVSTDEESPTADYIADDIGRVVDSLEERGVNQLGVVTDNTSTNRAAWIILQTKYPNKFFHGCVSHGLHLLVKDIFAATKADRGRDLADHPDGCAFDYLLEFSQDCEDVVSFFSNHHLRKAKLNKAQKQEKLPSLVQPATPRWGILKSCFESLLRSKPILHSIVSARDFIHKNFKQKASRQKVFEIMTSSDFVKYLEKSIAILQPIDEAIVVFQDDKVPLSKVYNSLNLRIRKYFEELLLVTADKRSYLLKFLEYRA
jgi:hypothetical protein